MREIKFRGKRIDNDKWVYGDVIHDISEHNAPRICVDREYSTGATFVAIAPRVVYKTLGQYTGLKDKNGVEIYEGDICACFCRTQIFSVEYCEERCGYFFDDCVICGGAEPMPECLGNLKNTIEVIGNIYDNPELLKSTMRIKMGE